MTEEIRLQLHELADAEYAKFSASLIPGTTNILGVRLPALRKIAKGIAKGNYNYYLQSKDILYFEETMLQGMIIGYVRIPWKDKEPLIREFVPKITTWSVCDTFCAGLKFKPEEERLAWQFIQSYIKSKDTYSIRFAIVMMLNYFVKQQYAEKAFNAFNKIKSTEYYVRMAIAWAISFYYRKLPTETMTFLRDNVLCDWTYNKALQKITESLSTDAETKQMIRSMKRK